MNYIYQRRPVLIPCSQNRTHNSSSQVYLCRQRSDHSYEFPEDIHYHLEDSVLTFRYVECYDSMYE